MLHKAEHTHIFWLSHETQTSRLRIPSVRTASAFLRESCGTSESPPLPSSQTKPHQVALEPDEVDPHEDGVLRAAAKGLDLVHKVGAELVAPFQDAQNHDVVVAQVVHDVPSETLRPGNRKEEFLLEQGNKSASHYIYPKKTVVQL